MPKALLFAAAAEQSIEASMTEIWLMLVSQPEPIPRAETATVADGPMTILTPTALSAGSASRPQLRWREEVDNSDRPFVPKLRSKPNAVAPLALTLVHSEEVSRSEGRTASWPPTWYANPYAAELDAFAPSEAQLTPPAKQRLFPPVHTTPCTWVATEAALHRLVATLGGADEFALDLEHHSHRSYRGITCLMQLSTREEVRPQTTKRAQQRRPGAGARGVSAAHTRSRHRQW